MPTSSPAPAAARGVSALPGCYIFLLGAFLISGTAIWAIYTFLRQADELSAFTDPDPAPLAAVAVDPEKVEALRARLREFDQAAAAGNTPELTLTADDLNIMLAGFPRLSSLQPMLQVRHLGPDATFTADIRFPMNSLPGRRRFLNGQLDGRFGVHPEVGLFVSALDVRVPGRTVPAGFIEVYQRGIIPGKNFGFLDEMLIRNFRDDPAFATTLKRITRLQSSPQGLTLFTSNSQTNPRSSTADTSTTEVQK
jgi:hypothetical protein